MGMSRSPGAYADIAAVLDTVLRHDQWPATYSCATPAAAHHWRHRANYFRSIMRRIEEERLGLPHGTGTSIYDGIVIAIAAETIILRKRESSAGILVIDGEVIDASPNPFEDQPLRREQDDDFDL